MDAIGEPAPPVIPPWSAGWRRLVAARRTLLLAALAIALLWSGITRMPPLDRAESRNAQAAERMLEPGEAGLPDPSHDRHPAGIARLQAAAVSLLGTPGQRDIRAERVPGALAALASVLLTRHIAAVLYGPDAGFIAGLLLALTPLLGAGARIATVDAPLLAAILAAQAALLAVWRRRDAPPPPAGAWVAPAIFWAANGIGLTLAGPPILAVTFGTLLGLAAMQRQARWVLALRPWPGLALMLALGLPWITGGASFAGPPDDSLPGGWPALLLLTFWPGSLFAARALPWVWSTRRTAGTQFLLAWIVPVWILLAAIPARLPEAVLPICPAVAALAAGAICAPGSWRLGRAGRVLAGGFAALWLLAGLGFALAGPVLLAWLEHRVVWLAVFPALVAALLVVHASRQAKRPAPIPALACAGVAALVISLSTWLQVLPALQTLWLTPRIAAAVRAQRPCPDSVLAAASYAEPSLIYLLGDKAKLTGPAEAAAFLHEQPACGLALIDASDNAAFAERARALGLSPQALTRIDGIDYVTGRRLGLTLYEEARPGALPLDPAKGREAPGPHSF